MLPRSRPTVAANRAINTWDKYLPPGQQTIGEPLRKINDSMLCDWNPRSTAKANGDGSFVVPGPDGPLATIRLVNIRDGVEDVELFQRGYGKDPAEIARNAIRYAGEKGIDVVLVDTAGRMQGNEPLMREIAKLVSVNDPDLVLFVGEALTGNDAIDQVTKFQRSLIDMAPDRNRPRGIIMSCLLGRSTYLV